MFQIYQDSLRHYYIIKKDNMPLCHSKDAIFARRSLKAAIEDSNIDYQYKGITPTNYPLDEDFLFIAEIEELNYSLLEFKYPELFI